MRGRSQICQVICRMFVRFGGATRHWFSKPESTSYTRFVGLSVFLVRDRRGLMTLNQFVHRGSLGGIVLAEIQSYSGPRP